MPPKGRRAPEPEFSDGGEFSYGEDFDSPPPPKVKKPTTSKAGPTKSRTAARDPYGDEEVQPEKKKKMINLLSKGGGDEPKGPAGPTTNRPASSKFSQQQLWACRPILTPIYVVAIFLFIACLFIPLGGACLAASLSVVETRYRYDDYCMRNFLQSNQTIPLGQLTFTTKQAEDALNMFAPLPGLPYYASLSCQIDIIIPKKMKQPVFMYYELDNYYQNHRRYVKSRSDAELRGDKTTASALTFCEPELYDKVDYSFKNETSRIKPCGLVAWSYFNDTYTIGYIKRADGQEDSFGINDKGIAWKTDRNKKFGDVLPQNFNLNPNTRGGFTLNGPVNQDEHFMVWMRTAPLPRFRKLYGRIETDLLPGDTLRLKIANRYNSYRYKGSKTIVLTTNSWLGGKNEFLGIAFLVAGLTSFVFAGLFFALDRLHPRKVGDLSYLSWNKVKK